MNNNRKEAADVELRTKCLKLDIDMKDAVEQVKRTAKAEREGDFPIGPVQHLVEAVLLKWIIRRQAYFGGAFIGPHVKLLTENAVKIFIDITAAMKTAVKDEKRNAIDAKMKEFSDFFQRSRCCLRWNEDNHPVELCG